MRDAGLPRSRVSGIYRKIAPVYDTWARLTESKARERCLELVAIRNGETVLEVAAGTGLMFARILEATPAGRNEGVDLTDAMLARARRRAAESGADHYRLRIGDAYDLDFEDNSFDVLVNNYMFDLLPRADFPAVLAEFRRVLRPGGRLALVNMTHGERWYNRIWDSVYRINPALLGGCRGVTLLADVKNGGFRDVRREYLTQWTFPSEIIVAQAT
jgi:ubiquinone/menaquinone biosynthesis C-methylase UbiE